MREGPGGGIARIQCSLVLAAGLALIALALPLRAWAAPGLEGVTGLLNVPTAEVAKDGELFLGCGRNENRVRYPGRTQRNYFAGVGFLPGLELTARYIDFPEIQDPSVPGFGTRKDRSVNAKLQLLAEERAPLALAVGMYDVGGKAVIERGTYAVATKTVGPAQLTVGFGDERFDGLFGGIALSPAPELELIAEYDSYDYNFGVRVSPHPDWHLTVGSAGGDFVAGLSYGKVVPHSRRPQDRPPEQAVVRAPLADDIQPENLDALAAQLAREGLENVECKARPGELAVKYENRRFRHEQDAWAYVCLWAAVHAPEGVEKLRIVSQREGLFSVVTEFDRGELLAYVNGELEAAEFARSLTIRDYAAPGYDYDYHSALHRPACGSTDVYLYPANTLDLGRPNAPVRQRSGLGIKHTTALARGITLFGREEVPLSNNLDNRDYPFAMQEVLNLYQMWEPGFYGVLQGGYFGEHRWGAQAELQKYWDGSRFSLGVSGGIARNKAWDRWDDQILAAGSVSIPRLDLTLTGRTGRFITGDEGYMLELGRRFGGYSVELFLYNTDYTDVEAGARVQVPLPGYAEAARHRWRLSVAPDYLYEYRTAPAHSAGFLHFGGRLDAFRMDLLPWHLRENLFLLRVAAGVDSARGD